MAKKRSEVEIKTNDKKINKNNKNEFKFVENLICNDFNTGDFEQMLDEVAKIFYNHICQLTKIQINSGSFNSNVLTGASFNG